MEQLTLEHLAGYLPYGLKIRGKYPMPFGLEDDGEYDKYAYPLALRTISGCLRLQEKPILRPLSDLTKPITHNGETFVPMDTLKRLGKNKNLRDTYIQDSIDSIDTWWNSMLCPYWIVRLLFEWHFDIHNLIQHGLAVDLNTIEQ